MLSVCLNPPNNLEHLLQIHLLTSTYLSYPLIDTQQPQNRHGHNPTQTLPPISQVKGLRIVVEQQEVQAGPRYCGSGVR